jgi:hypothetical protein
VFLAATDTDVSLWQKLIFSRHMRRISHFVFIFNGIVSDRRLPMTRFDNGRRNQLMTNLSYDVTQYYLDFKSPRRINSTILR